MSTARLIASFIYSQLFVTPTYPKDNWKGKTVIVTGSNTGLGQEAARHFVRLGASKVILGVRNQAKGQTAKENIAASEKCTKDVIEVWSLDLSSFDSVKAFAEKAKSLDRIDALVENAGISTIQFQLAEGHESTITTNVISTFLLALLMLPQLQATAKQYSVQPHITIVTSEMHYFAQPVSDGKRPIFEALDDPKTADMGARYPVSKLLEVYALREIVKDYLPAPAAAAAAAAVADNKNDSSVILNCVNPGFCHSELTRELGLPVKILKAVLARTTEVGSRTLVHAASAGAASHGQYLSDCEVGTVAQSVVAGRGPELQSQVWTELKAILEGIEPGVISSL